MATTPKLYEAACKGSHTSQGGPDDDGPEESIAFDYGKLGSENADSVTGAGDPSAPMDCANNLKQIVLAVHALDSVQRLYLHSTPRQPAPHQTTRGHIPRATSR